jgi:transposase-like protein
MGSVALTWPGTAREVVVGEGRAMSVFKRRWFPTETILGCVRWYCRHGISYHVLPEMTHERGVTVDHTTIFRWAQRYAPEIEKCVRWYQGYRSASWRVDETYVRIGGEWKYLFRAVDKAGRVTHDRAWLDRQGEQSADFIARLHVRLGEHVEQLDAGHRQDRDRSFRQRSHHSMSA